MDPDDEKKPVRYDLFISYARRDNQQGRVTELVARIARDFEAFAGGFVRRRFKARLHWDSRRRP